MSSQSRALSLTLGLSLFAAFAAPAAARAPIGVVEAPTQTLSRDPDLLIADALTGDRLDLRAADRLYARAVISEDLEGVYAQLDGQAAGADPARACRIAVLKAILQWRDGEIAAATGTLSVASEPCQSTDALRLRGQLLDIQNQAEAASVWYERARAQSDDARERAWLDRRLAIMGAIGGRPEALSMLADNGDADLANRAAAVLGLLGRPGDAADIYRPRPSGGAHYQETLRLADWEIQRGASGAGAASAWEAAEAAGTAQDRLYALALVVEAYRQAGDLSAAERFLAQQPPGAEVRQTRLDVLVELRRYDDAIALIRTGGDDELSEALVGVLRAAARMAEVEAEYRRLIQEQPSDPRWADGLAALYLDQGRVDEVVEVYRGLSSANSGHPQIRIETARKMIAMGLGGRAMAADDDETSMLAVAVRRLEVEAAIDEGRADDAEVGLRALSETGEGDPSVLAAVAEDYERLGRRDLALETLLGVEARGGVLNDDQQAHLADLAFAAGRPGEALARWRILWSRTELPARRVLLQRQIIRAAQQTGQLETMAADLEGRITAAAADQKEVGLLVEMRIAQQDGEGAERAVRYAERSGSGEAGALQQLAAVQARLRDNAGLSATLMRLVEVDATNADAYLRRLIINILRFPDPAETDADRNRRIDDLMTRLRAAGGLNDAETARFSASIYASGFRPAEALVQHRRALALAPSDVDALLEYAAARRAAGEIAQAASLLQFKAETAPDGAAFVAAMNGLIDVLAAGDANSVKPPADLVQSRLAWARRAALERILQDGDDVRLSSLVGDIGQDLGEAEMQIRALQASLAVAGDQKPAVLRQLISLTSDTEAGPGDPARKSVYGRRLVAMRRAYPPEVYADLARTFLEQGDFAGAERAFSLMDDIGGLVDVQALRGEAYAGAGMAREALASYRLALRQDRGNPDLISRTAVLTEQSGARAEASALYWRGLNSLVQRQPLRRLDDAPKAVDAAQLSSLTEGALRTWPGGETAARLSLWRSAVRDAAEADRDATAKLADFPRLAVALAVNQRLAAVLDDDGLRTLQGELMQAFHNDPQAQDAVPNITQPVPVETTGSTPELLVMDPSR